MARPTEYCEDYPQIVDKYVEESQYPSIEGLALELNCHKDTIYSWEKDDDKAEFSDALARLRNAQGKKLWERGLNGMWTTPIVKLGLANHGYYDKSETDVTSKGEKIEYVIRVENKDND